MLRPFQFLAATAALVALLLSEAEAQDDSELAKKTQNPVADLISVPLQSNFNFGGAGKAIDVMKLAPEIKQSPRARDGRCVEGTRRV